jgi:hypothetical protein
MVQLRWQEPADGSDTLAIAQIRLAPDTAIPLLRSVRLYARYVRLIRFSFLILIGRFVTLDL